MLRKIESCVLLLAVLAVTLMTGGPSAAQDPPSPIDAKIQIVWPHNRQGNPVDVGAAPLVNVEVYLFQRGTLNPVACDLANKVILRWSRNEWAGRPGAVLYPAHDLLDDPGPGSAVGERIMRTVEGKTFPVWVFNDVPTLLGEARLSWVTTYFFVEVEGADARSNVWAHGGDVRTVMPGGYPPTRGVSEEVPSVIDALIAVVWPHDGEGHPRPVAEAPLVNVGVELAEHPAVAGRADWRSAPASLGRSVRLLRALNSGYLEPAKPADRVVTQTQQYADALFSWPRWEFNDVDVSAARDPLNRYYLAVQVDGVPTHTTIWAHGADARTYFPQRDVPARGCGG